VAAVLVIMIAALAVMTTTAQAGTGGVDRDPAHPPYPPVGKGTAFLDHEGDLTGLPEREWYEANIPFVDLPDREIEETYYYRWRVYKEALKYTTPDSDYIVTEFLGPVGYAAPYGGIVAAAGHHVYEGRWLRDRRYLDDYLDYWLRGPGSGPKPKEDFVNANTDDWAHQYSFWAADAVFARASVTGDFAFALRRLPELQRQWDRWTPQFDSDLGLYWQTPVWDAMEFTASSYQSDDPYHGGDGFRPTINAYQYGDAVAIGRLARLTGDGRTAERYEARAAALRGALNARLWDPRHEFFKHMHRDDNPARALIDDREQIGFVPWYFHMAEPGHAAAWRQLLDSQGFRAPFGPTTAERRSRWFMHDALVGCCRWDGPSWPFATSQTMTALANLLIDYPPQDAIGAAAYYDLLHRYALTQRKHGRPYVAEAHHPDEDRWLYDARGHSEDYNHSTFNDLVLSGLLGIRPRADDTLVLAPLVPASWDWFAVENLPYHGHNVTVLWDRDGSRYGRGGGLQVFVDGARVAVATVLRRLRVRIGERRPQQLPQLANDAANPARDAFPRAFASFTSPVDDAQRAIDGQDFHLDVPNTRWTSYSSPNATDFLGVDFGLPTPVSDVRFSLYDDGGGVRAPVEYRVQHWRDGSWADVEGAVRTPSRPAGGTLNRVTFAPVVTSRIRIVFTPQPGAGVGVTELESWSPASDAAHVPVALAGGEQLRPGSPAVATATFENVSDRAATDVTVDLRVPDGWRATPISETRAAAVPPDSAFATRWQLTPPAHLAPGSRWPVVASAAFGPGSRRATAHSRSMLETAFDLGHYETVQRDDGFDADTSAAYAALQPFANERLPTVTVGGGRFAGSADGRFFALYDSGEVPRSSDAVVVLDAAAFIGDAPAEDSLFVGLVADADDYVGAWYNNHHRTTGFDVRVDGRFLDAGNCCTAVHVSPGDRLAVQLDGDTLRSWHLSGGTWSELRSIEVPGIDLTDPATLRRYRFMFGLRGDAGTIAVDRFEARSRG
jgi:hypothetical protein